jgi:hypothetical protein
MNVSRTPKHLKNQLLPSVRRQMRGYWHLTALCVVFLLLFVIQFFLTPETVWAASDNFRLSANSTVPVEASRDRCDAIPGVECDALWSLYLQTNGDSWENRSGWFVTANPCLWHGVTCREVGESTHGNFAGYTSASSPSSTEAATRVVGIDLSWNRLVGVIPTDLDKFNFLTTLNLSGNDLSGSIPETLGKLSQLLILNLSENHISGQAPAQLGDLSKLRVLHLFENDLQDFLPAELTKLKQLYSFKFQNTFLCVPEDSDFKKWLASIYGVSRPAASDCRRTVNVARPLLLIYAGLDNDLTSEWGTLVNNIERGIQSDRFDVKLLIDGKGANNSYEYTLMRDSDSACPSMVLGEFTCDRYRLHQTLRAANEEIANRDTLSNFIVNSLLEYPKATQLIVALVGHGAGWGANALPSQPRIWREQSGVVVDIAGGMLWDDTAADGGNDSQSLSTQALGEALQRVHQLTGRTVDLLYLDACSMAMSEVVYEVRANARYVLASQNTKWAAFRYDLLLNQLTDLLNGAGDGVVDVRELGKRWLNSEVAYVSSAPGYAYTFSLIDSARMSDVVTSTTTLAQALRTVLPDQHDLVRQVFEQTSHFDTDYNSEVTSQDAYIDLYEFALYLANAFPDPSPVAAAARQVQSAVQSAVVLTRYDNGIENASSSLNAFSWRQLGGLSIYTPLFEDEARRQELYNPVNLTWAADSLWEEWLTDYWKKNATADKMTICAQTSGCDGITGWGEITWVGYLPYIADE